MLTCNTHAEAGRENRKHRLGGQLGPEIRPGWDQLAVERSVANQEANCGLFTPFRFCWLLSRGGGGGVLRGLQRVRWGSSVPERL